MKTTHTKITGPTTDSTDTRPVISGCKETQPNP